MVLVHKSLYRLTVLTINGHNVLTKSLVPNPILICRALFKLPTNIVNFVWTFWGKIQKKFIAMVTNLYINCYFENAIFNALKKHCQLFLQKNLVLTRLRTII